MKYQEITSFRNLELYCLKKKEREKSLLGVNSPQKRKCLWGVGGIFIILLGPHNLKYIAIVNIL